MYLQHLCLSLNPNFDEPSLRALGEPAFVIVYIHVKMQLVQLTWLQHTQYAKS